MLRRQQSGYGDTGSYVSAVQRKVIDVERQLTTQSNAFIPTVTNGIDITGEVTAGGDISTNTGFVGDALDSINAGTLSIGVNTATRVDIADIGIITNVRGSLLVDKATTFNKPIIIPPTNDASTTSQTPIVSALNAFTRFTGTSSFTYTLPNMSGGGNDGMQLTFYKSGVSGTITIAANAADTGLIEGGTIALSSQYDRVTIRYVLADLRWIIV